MFIKVKGSVLISLISDTAPIDIDITGKLIFWHWGKNRKM